MSKSLREKDVPARWLASSAITAIMTMVGASAFLSAPALAADEDNIGIEEVVVTARKVQESSQDVPIAITAISMERLESATIRDLVDLNGFAPNVQIDEDGSRGGGGANITIRGISPTRSDDNSFDSPIGVMIDGIFLGSLAGQVLENFDLAGIEVLRGPQGTLFGKNTVGGVVHVKRSRPTGEFGGKVRMTFGQYGQQEYRGVLNTSIVDDVLALKLFGTSQQDDGFMRNITTGSNVSDKDYQNYGATFLYTPNDDFEATFTIEKFKDTSGLGAFQTNYNTAPGVLPVPTDPNETDYSGGFANCLVAPYTCRNDLSRPRNSENDTDNAAELETDAYTLNMSYAINENLTVLSITGYRELDEYRIYDFDASSRPFITIERFNEFEQFSQELILNGEFDKLSFTTGLYYWNSEFEQDWATGGDFWRSLFGGVVDNPGGYGACLAGAFAPIACDPGLTSIPTGDVLQILFETQETTSVAIFAQGDYRVTDKLTLTAGLRWTEEKKEFVAGQSYLTSAERQFNRAFQDYADLENTWTELSPKAGITYNLTDDAILYLTYAEGFHSGGFFGVNQNVRDFERDQYDPEIAKSWELGLKSQWMDNRVRLNATLFRNDFQDKQESSVQQDPDTLTVATVFDNVADATYQGFELETQFVVSKNLRLFFNYGFLDAEYSDFETDINAADGITLVEDASFLTPRNSPENTFGGGGTFSVELGQGSLEIYAKYAWVDERETNLLNVPNARLDSIEDVTASIGYYTDQWSLQAYGRNLTDQRNEAFVPIATLFAAGSVNRPRTAGIEFTYRFGGEFE